MGSTAAVGQIGNLLNYTGVFAITGNIKTPFATVLGLNSMSRNGGQFRSVGATTFPMSNTKSLDAASTPAHTEASLVSAGTSTIYANTQNVNTVCAFRETVTLSEAKLRDRLISGVAINGDPFMREDVQSQLDAHILQAKVDFNYSIINSTRVAWSSDGLTAGQIGGLYTGIAAGTNYYNAGGAPLTTDLFENSLVAAFAPYRRGKIAVLAKAAMIIKLNAIYRNPIQSITVAGVDVQTLYIPTLGPVTLIADEDVPANVIMLVDLDNCELVSNDRNPGDPSIAVVEMAIVGHGQSWDVFGMIGIDYGHESFHAALYNIGS